MPKGKKTAPFMIFVKDYQRKYPGLSLQEAIKAADSIWQEMSKDDKNAYKNLAKNSSIEMKDKIEKYTSQGVPMSFVEKEKYENEVEHSTMLHDIADTVNRNRNVGALADQKFYFIMGSYFFKQLNGFYIPAEIGLCEYSLNNGITNKLHEFIKPDVDIFSHTYDAQEHSKATHGLPIPPDSFGEELEQKYKNIVNFISKSGYASLPPVYIHEKFMPIIKSILDYLKESSDETDLREIKVYSLQQLFYQLKKATADVGATKAPNSIHITNALIDREYYEYQSGIACEFHEQIDKSNHCAQSYVCRWAFTFSDNLCADMNIDIQPGVHLPEDIDLSVNTKSNFNDFESIISGTSSNNTYVTQPGFEYCSFNSSFNNSDFPVLGGKSKKSRGVKSIDASTTFESFPDDKTSSDIDVNLWSVRSRNNTKPVIDEKYFNVSSRGRGILLEPSPLQKALNDSSISISSKKSHGRGKLLFD